MGSSRAGSVLWERAPPAKGWRQPPGRIPETFLFRCPVLRIRDAVQWWCLPGPLKPSLAAVSLALPGQTAPSRHHHCTAHFAAAPPRVITPPDPQGRSLESSKEPRDRVGSLERKVSGILPGASLPFAGWARSHKACFHSLGFVEWFGGSDDPWRWFLRNSEVPGRAAQDRVWPGMAKRRAYRDVLVACPGQPCPAPRPCWRESTPSGRG